MAKQLYVKEDNKKIKIDASIWFMKFAYKMRNALFHEIIKMILFKINSKTLSRNPTEINQSFNYKDLDKSLDLNQVFMKPYKNRKENLFDSIDRMVVLRNELVHEGKVSSKVDMKSVKRFMDDIEETANRIYKTFGREYSFKPNFDF